jgi:hypothetical protein
MLKHTKLSLITLGALALILVLGLAAFAPIGTANAAELTHQQGPNGRESSRGGRGGKQGPGFGGGKTYLAEALGITTEELQAAHEEARSNFKGTNSETDMETLLAEALGISTDELTVAREASRDAAIEQALADGKITEEQVTMMEAWQALKNDIHKDELLAKALGITVEELEAAKEEGQRIPELMEALGIEQEDFEASMQAEWEAALQQAVEDGIINQEQADLLLESGFQGKHGPGRRGGFPGRNRNSGAEG